MWIKIYCEKWLLGSTRWELSHSERAIFIDILARSAINDPPGQINFVSFDQLAQHFAASVELVKITIDKGIEYKKFRLKVKENSKEMILVVKNWGKFQSEYLRQKKYRKSKKPENNRDGKVTDKVTPEVTEKLQPKLQESYSKKRGEEKRGEEKNQKQIFNEEALLKEFEDLWFAWPQSMRKNKRDALEAYRKLRKSESVERISQAFNGYMAFLKHQRVKENFDQKPSYPATFLRNNRWKEHEGFQYRPPL